VRGRELLGATPRRFACSAANTGQVNNYERMLCFYVIVWLVFAVSSLCYFFVWWSLRRFVSVAARSGDPQVHKTRL